jgi:hypothetical protein
MIVLQIIVILFVCRVVGWLARQIGQPAVVGEMIAGVVLGPSLFGLFFPGPQAWLFPEESRRLPALFSMLVLMAVVTTFMTSPVFEWVYGRHLRQLGEQRAAALAS